MTAQSKKKTVFLAYQETRGFLSSYLRRFYNNRQDIEDAMQEGFLKTFEIEQKQAIDSPSAYLFMTVKNFARRDLKKKSRLKVEGIEDIDDASLSIDRKAIEDSLESRQTLAIFCDAADALPDQCRKAFLLRKIYGFTQKEIAELMGISVSTVEKHLAKGLLRSMEYMAGQGDTRPVADEVNHKKVPHSVPVKDS
ncbi:RNA polymerase sigma factor [Paremcibacter congregatus]|nr:sigma-70 family RNA polymerase sigma factor [Paremcibacter congregatus]